jgi:hypothetical protein
LKFLNLWPGVRVTPGAPGKERVTGRAVTLFFLPDETTSGDAHAFGGRTLRIVEGVHRNWSTSGLEPEWMVNVKTPEKSDRLPHFDTERMETW